MARVTVEKCITQVPNRFELVMLAAARARALASGAQPTVAPDNDKSTIIALREIEDQTISVDELRDSVAQLTQPAPEADDDDLLALLELEMEGVSLEELEADVELAEFVAETMAQPTEDEIFSLLGESDFTELGGIEAQPEDDPFALVEEADVEDVDADPLL